MFLPFSPLLFRLSHPEAARSSYIFRIGTLGCIFLYFVFGADTITRAKLPLGHPKPAVQAYASEDAAESVRIKPESGTRLDDRTFAQRRAANEREFERLQTWYDSLRSRQRDLLRSDTTGIEAYNLDRQQYETALSAANAEKQALATAVLPK